MVAGGFFFVIVVAGGFFFVIVVAGGFFFVIAVAGAFFFFFVATAVLANRFAEFIGVGAVYSDRIEAVRFDGIVGTDGTRLGDGTRLVAVGGGVRRASCGFCWKG